MKKIYLSMIVALAAVAVNAEDTTVDFEDINLAENSFDNGSAGNGDFKSGGYSFYNEYHADYGGYYYGFTISTQTSTAYEALTDQYNSCVGFGADGSKTYSVCYFSTWGASPVSIKNTNGNTFSPKSIAVTNAAYAFNSMRFGDTYARKFTETDYFTLSFIGYKDNAETNTVTVDLAKEGMALFTWKTIDLSELGEVDEIRFSMVSSDPDTYGGYNTPMYFCIDNFVTETSTTPVNSVAATINSVKAVGLYSADGQELTSFNKGVNILKMSDGSAQKIFK